jgi:hypothetical protein
MRYVGEDETYGWVGEHKHQGRTTSVRWLGQRDKMETVGEDVRQGGIVTVSGRLSNGPCWMDILSDDDAPKVNDEASQLLGSSNSS